MSIDLNQFFNFDSLTEAEVNPGASPMTLVTGKDKVFVLHSLIDTSNLAEVRGKTSRGEEVVMKVKDSIPKESLLAFLAALPGRELTFDADSLLLLKIKRIDPVAEKSISKGAKTRTSNVTLFLNRD